MYRIERKPWWYPYRPWHWTLIISSYGMAEGRTWTKRGAEKELIMMQGRWFAQ